MKGMVKFGRNDRDMLYYFSGTRLVDTDTVQLVNSLTTAPVTLDINIAHGLLGHPDTRSVTAMATKHGWTLTGTVKPCGTCALAKARAKAIPKSTMTKAKTPGEDFSWTSLVPTRTLSTRTSTGFVSWMTTPGTVGTASYRVRVVFKFLC